MIVLQETLLNWHKKNLKRVLKQELTTLKTNTLPLHLATTQGGIINTENLDLIILSTAETNKHIEIKTGIFFTEIVGGCNCDDAPSETEVYCILLITINKKTAHSSFTIKDY